MEEHASGNILLYRWNAIAEGFNMPISYELETGEVKWLHPTPSWQILYTGVGGISDLHFHMERFYITAIGQ